jgi:hypothetical protein
VSADVAAAPNQACSDSHDPDFDGLYVWSNNVTTLSLSNALADLHELCGHLKANNISITALQEINIDLTQTAEHFNNQCTLICASTHIH